LPLRASTTLSSIGVASPAPDPVVAARSYLVIVLPSRLIIINHVLTPTIVEMNSLRTADTGPA
jgi:hypothetical protein